MRDVDVIVVGLGGMGSAALYHLARRGAAPLGLDQYAVGHTLGSSHGHSRSFRILYHDALYVRMVQDALPLWLDLEDVSGEHLLCQNGMLVFARPDNERFAQCVRVLKECGVQHHLLDCSEVADRFPELQIPEEATACHTSGAGILDANCCVVAHAAQARRFGAVIEDDVAVHSIDLGGDRPELETSAGRYRCSRLVVTPGPWAGKIFKQLDLPLHVTRQQKFYFEPSRREPYHPNRFPIYADWDLHNYGFPVYGEGMKLAADAHGPVTDPETVDRTLDMGTCNQLKEWAEGIMPGLELSFVGGATCMYTMTSDKDFLIGPHPDNPNVFVGAGFSGHGFKFCTLVGKIMADLTVDGTTSQPIERFRLDRFGTCGHD